MRSLINLFSILLLLFGTQSMPLRTSAAEDSPGDETSEPQSMRPLSPDESLALIQIPEGLRVELVASEPAVVDPIAVRFDEFGRMWVIEMRDYPHGPAEGQSPMSSIRLLEDKNRDGTFESSTLFAEGLLFPTGLQPWQGGILVTLSGRIIYLKDTNGDGRADEEQTWFKGFAEENPQLRANHPRFALDNHIYVANGLRGGNIISTQIPDKQPLPIGGRDFRFDPITREFDHVGGHGQFGLTFDDFGNRFICSNRNPLRHVALEDRYLSVNPEVGISSTVVDVAQSQQDSRLYPIRQGWTTSLRHAGQFTAACGVLIYRGSALPEAYRGNAFTCDPTGSLVHREILESTGATFRSRPARDGVEFLASADPWFKPVNLRIGPDGALYVVDICRAIIEHPQWMPEELQQRGGFRLGEDRGRIYRIVTADSPPPQPLETLADASAESLAGLLEHANSWQRETAARLLYERQDQDATQRLQWLIENSQHPVGRVHALWTLRGMKQLSESTLRTAIHDPHPRVREHAAVLAEPLLATSEAIRSQLVDLAGDPDSRVRFQAILSLATGPQPVDVKLLRTVVTAGLEDPWTRNAVSLAAGQRHAKLLTELLEQMDWIGPGRAQVAAAFLEELTALASKTSDSLDLVLILETLTRLPEGNPYDRIKRRMTTAVLRSVGSTASALEKIKSSAGDTSLIPQLDLIIRETGQLAGDSKAVESDRAEALALLAYVPSSQPDIAAIALDEPGESIRANAILTTSGMAAVSMIQKLLTQFPQEGPTIRRAILDAALRRADTADLLLEEVAASRIKTAEMGRHHIDALLKHENDGVRERAEKVLADTIPEDRKKVLANYQHVLELDSDPRRGREVFRKHCATCHRIGELGVDVAPDIADSYSRKREQLLTDILQPNRAIDANYIMYVLETVEGRILNGVMVSQTATSVTLKQPEGKTFTILRSEIEQVQSSGISLMPEGLEQNIPPADMADLITFIKEWRYLDEPLFDRTSQDANP